MKFILGKKVNMTQIWDNDKVIAVTKVSAGPCFITQIKDVSTDSYQAVQLAYGEKKVKNISKPVRGHLKKAGITQENSRHIKEFRINELKPEMKVGGLIDVSTFKKGDIIDVTGVSKGKGFQGSVKRHGFSGHKSTHGNKDQERTSGSVGAKGPARIFKGTRMPGRMGGDQVTVKNLEIIDIDLENNVLFIKGAIPGCESGLVIIKGEGDLIIKDKSNKVEEIKEEVVNEEAQPETEVIDEVEEKIEEVKEKEEEKVEEVVTEDKTEETVN
ncbi:MAG TPA: 50S ribosomal protein L3 [bacterium]|nr:50S ribosomal protein L3 [bacterium]